MTHDAPSPNTPGPGPEGEDARLDAPAARRNREPLLAVLSEVLPHFGTVLELGSGTGQHAVFFSDALSPLLWLPSDPRPEARASILAWAETAEIEPPLPPRTIDVTDPDWDVVPGDDISAMVSANMIHIAPWEACLGLLAGAGRYLPPGGPLCIYGPFRRDGRHTSPGNESFDQDLRSQDPRWGIRDLEAVTAAAEASGLVLDEVRDMPANNLTIIYRKPRPER